MSALVRIRGTADDDAVRRRCGVRGGRRQGGLWCLAIRRLGSRGSNTSLFFCRFGWWRLGRGGGAVWCECLYGCE